MDKSNGTQTNIPKEELFNEQCSDCRKNIKVSRERAEKYETFLCDKCKEKRWLEKVIKKAKTIIPKKFWCIDTEKPLDEYEYKICSLFLHGKAGVGKTVLACSLAKLYIRQGYEVKFISYPAFIMDLQGMFLYKDADAYGYAKEVACFKGELIIDDLGAVKLTDFVRQITYYIINEREMKCLPTIITSNFGLNEIDEMIDSRISSRISGMCEVLQIKGKDRRLKTT